MKLDSKLPTSSDRLELNVNFAGAGYPILCLHGHPGSSGCMSVFTDFLSRSYLTLAPDLRGYGKSTVREPFPIETHLDDLEALLDRLNIGRCLLLGWSLGGMLAIELALRNPQRYSGLILIATAARPRGSHPPISRSDQLYTGIAGTLNWLSPGWQWNIDTFGKRSLFRYLFSHHQPSAYRYLASYGVPAYLQTSSHASNALKQAMSRGYNACDRLDRLGFPCLVLAGERDRHITAQSSHETARALQNCQWRCYDEVAHLFPWEIPERVEQDMTRWLAAYPEITSGSY